MSRSISRTQNLVYAAVFAALTAIGAFLQVPLGFTSITLQFLCTALAGILLGPKWGAVSQAVYVILGLAGLPIFTKGGGFHYIYQPSFGFLLGLVPCAGVVGALAGTKGEPKRIIPACVAGLAVVYLIGLPYMGAIFNLYMGKNLGVREILQMGMLVYLPGDALKIAVTTAVSPILCRRLRSSGTPIHPASTLNKPC